MICEEFHLCKTVVYGNRLLDRTLAEGHIDHREYDLIKQYLVEKSATSISFGGARYVDVCSTLTHLRRTQYCPDPWHQLTTPQVLQLFSDLKKLPMRKMSKEGKIIYQHTVYGQNTLKTKMRILKHFLHWMSANKIIDISVDTINKLSIPTYKPHKIDPNRVYTEQQVSTLVRHANSVMMQAMIWMHFETGCRPNEIVSVRWSDIAWKDQSAEVSITDTKQNQIRKAMISIQTLGYLIPWRNLYPGDPSGSNYIFLDQNGKYMSYLVYSNHLKRVFTLANRSIKRSGGQPLQKFSPHDIRRWRTTDLQRKKVSRPTIAMMLWGNVHTNTDSVYSQFNQADAISEMEVTTGIKSETPTQKPLSLNYCPACKTLHPSSTRFCSECGTALIYSAAADPHHTDQK